MSWLIIEQEFQKIQGSVREKGWKVGSRERKQYYQPEFKDERG